MLDPNACPDMKVQVLVAAEGNVSILMGLLRQSPSICKVQERPPRIHAPRGQEEMDPLHVHMVEETDGSEAEGMYSCIILRKTQLSFFRHLIMSFVQE